MSVGGAMWAALYLATLWRASVNPCRTALGTKINAFLVNLIGVPLGDLISCARDARNIYLTSTKGLLKVKNINAKSLVGISHPFYPERKRAHSKLAFFVSAIFLLWWCGMGDLRVGRSLGGMTNLYRAITRKLVISFDGLYNVLTRGITHVT